MRIAINNGPNLNLLGKREPEIYGAESFDLHLKLIREKFPQTKIHYFQSNVEGEIINELQRVGFEAEGIIFNPGGYTHTSVAIGDTVAAITSPVIEVHISNVFSREPFRHHSFVSPHALAVITGMGLLGYDLAVQYLLESQG